MVCYLPAGVELMFDPLEKPFFWLFLEVLSAEADNAGVWGSSPVSMFHGRNCERGNCFSRSWSPGPETGKFEEGFKTSRRE